MQEDLTRAVVALRAGADQLLAAPVLTETGDPKRFIAQAAELRKVAEDVVAAAVQQARHDGASWKDVGEALGVTRQAAFQRYGKPIDPRTGEPMNTTPLPQASALASAVIDALAAGDWAAVVGRFDAQMAEQLSQDALTAAWAQVIGQVGAFEGYETPEVSRAADVTVTNTPLNFEAGEFIARISFRDDETIAGFFILDPKHV